MQTKVNRRSFRRRDAAQVGGNSLFEFPALFRGKTNRLTEFRQDYNSAWRTSKTPKTFHCKLSISMGLVNVPVEWTTYLPPREYDGRIIRISRFRLWNFYAVPLIGYFVFCISVIVTERNPSTTRPRWSPISSPKGSKGTRILFITIGNDKSLCFEMP